MDEGFTELGQGFSSLSTTPEAWRDAQNEVEAFLIQAFLTMSGQKKSQGAGGGGGGGGGILAPAVGNHGKPAGNESNGNADD